MAEVSGSPVTVSGSTLDEFISSMTQEVDLPDGTSLGLRPIRPEDREHLVVGFERLSAESRLLRFFTAVQHLSTAQLDYFTQLDYVDHFAWVAIDRSATARPESTDEGLGVGIARYIRLVDDPSDAEMAVVIADEYQGRGIGPVLVEALAGAARRHGIRRFLAYVRNENAAMLSVLGRFGGVEHFHESGVTRVEVSLDPPDSART